MLALRIATRYLFAKKSHRAINAITLVAACGVAVITAALICILSVYNGFEGLMGMLTSQLDPELKVVVHEGKTFHDAPELRQLLFDQEGIETVSATLEETVLIMSSGRQVPARMKGIDEQYRHISRLDSILLYGDTLLLEDGICHYAILGQGLAQLAANRAGYLRPMTFYCPKREGRISLTSSEEPFEEASLFCSACFAVMQSDYDDHLCFVSLDVARHLLQDSLLLSAYEIGVKQGADIARIKKELSQKLPGFDVLDRYDQQADNYRIVKIEKWLTFVLIVFILLIASFNLIGALSMLIIDKKEETDTLRFLGANERTIRQIFTIEGWLIAGTGAVAGTLIGVVLCLMQEHFGLIGIGDGSGLLVVDSYPVRLEAADVVLTVVTVGIVGFVATLIPTSRRSSR